MIFYFDRLVCRNLAIFRNKTFPKYDETFSMFTTGGRKLRAMSGTCSELFESYIIEFQFRQQHKDNLLSALLYNIRFLLSGLIKFSYFLWKSFCLTGMPTFVPVLFAVCTG